MSNYDDPVDSALSVTAGSILVQALIILCFYYYIRLLIEILQPGSQGIMLEVSASPVASSQSSLCFFFGNTLETCTHLFEGLFSLPHYKHSTWAGAAPWIFTGQPTTLTDVQ